MNLHEWITAQVEAVEVIAQTAEANLGNVLGWAGYIDHLVEMDERHIARHNPSAVLRRCEADRRILARHRLPEPGHWVYPGCAGCGTACDGDWPVTENINDCPELLDLAHAHGLTPVDLAALDRLEPVPVVPTVPFSRMAVTPVVTTDQVPPALRGVRWRRHRH